MIVVKGDLDGTLEIHHKCLAEEEKVLGEEYADTTMRYVLPQESCGEGECTRGGAYGHRSEFFATLQGVMQDEGDLYGDPRYVQLVPCGT